MSVEQVLTRFDDHRFEIAVTDQQPRRAGDVLSDIMASLVVRVSPPNPPIIRSQRASLLKAAGERPPWRTKPSTLRPPKKRRGGWPPTRWLAWDDVKEIVSIIRELTRLGFAPTHLMTIMPPEGSDSDRKRVCTRETAHLGQALKRHVGSCWDHGLRALCQCRSPCPSSRACSEGRKRDCAASTQTARSSRSENQNARSGLALSDQGAASPVPGFRGAHQTPLATLSTGPRQEVDDDEESKGTFGRREPRG